MNESCPAYGWVDACFMQLGASHRWLLSHMRDMTHSLWLAPNCMKLHASTQPYAGHDSFTRWTWLIHTLDMTHSHAWHDSSIGVTWLIYVCDSAAWYPWQNSHPYISVTWLMHARDTTYSSHGLLSRSLVRLCVRAPGMSAQLIYWPNLTIHWSNLTIQCTDQISQFHAALQSPDLIAWSSILI